MRCLETCVPPAGGAAHQTMRPVTGPNSTARPGVRRCRGAP